MSKSRVRRSAAERLVLVRERQAKALSAAQEAVRKAEERLAKAKARLERVEAETPHKVRLAELAAEMAEHRDALKRLRPQKAEAEVQAEPAEVAKPVNEVATSGGEVRELSRGAVKVVKSVIGRKRKGLLAPLDGAEAQSLLTALDEKGNVGDAFSVTFKGRKSPLHFTVVEEGLQFEAK